MMPGSGTPVDLTSEQRLRTLHHDHSARIFAYAARRTQNVADAADVVAETFVVAWRRIDDVPAGDEAAPWLFGVARNVLRNQHRGERRRRALDRRLGSELSRAVPEGGPDDAVDDVTAALARLDDDDRELLTLLAWDGLERAELANAFGVSRATLRVRLHRARRRLTAELSASAADLTGNGPAGVGHVRATAPTGRHQEHHDD